MKTRNTEKNWRGFWNRRRVYEPDLKRAKNPFYNLMMFPYPSAEGLHVGNMYAFVGADVYGRMKRMQGEDVFEPMGLDGFGIHSENYALKIGAHPARQAKVSEKRFYKQLESVGNGFAWNERLETYDPGYYRWTQWIFVQMFKRGLAYRKKQPVNWCPSCKTVLSDEQVVSGECERCGTRVVKKELEQWFFRITKYADRLLKNLDRLDWSERVRIAQRNWIGKSEGAIIEFKLKGLDYKIEVFTTRPDTIFGATYLVLAPENPLITALAENISNFKEVLGYVNRAKKKRDEERISERKAKTGVELKGVKAVNPASKEEIPVWVADYVLGSVGTGAIMAVPAHDERDFEFAMKHNLHIQPVISRRGIPIRSYLMGAENITDEELKKLHIRVTETTPKGHRRLEIPGESIQAYESLIKQKMAPGFWNEYVAEEAVFIFKHKDGEVERIILTPGTESRIDRLGAEFNNQKWAPSCVWGWLAKNDSYTDIIIHGEEGTLINSGKFSGMPSEKAKWEITKFVGGTRRVEYRLRDWLISRQRYWGPPIPMIYCESCAMKGRGEQKEMPGWYAVPEKDLPVKLPFVKDFRPKGTGVSPLASVKSFYEARCPACRGKARRETDVSDTFLDSAWYYLRYPSTRSARSGQIPWDPQITKKWFPVSMYTGGAEHSVLHLLYVRFLALALHDMGLLKFGKSSAPEGEPFPKFRAHGLLIKEGAKMSKSKGNIVNPDEYIEKFGADTLRMYLMFLAPFEQGGDFRDSGIAGITRFLDRVRRLEVENFSSKSKQKSSGEAYKASDEFKRLLHRTVKKVTDDIESLNYNTAISSLMILLGRAEELSRTEDLPRYFHETFAKLLAPFAPHTAEEIWHVFLGHADSIHRSPWPEYDPKLIRENTFVLVIQVGGKLRDTVEVQSGITESEAKGLALGREKIRRTIGSQEPKRIVYVPGKLINIVI